MRGLLLGLALALALGTGVSGASGRVVESMLGFHAGMAHSGSPAVAADSGSPAVAAHSGSPAVAADSVGAVRIAGLWWMKENLQSTTYRNGDSIRNGTSDRAAWTNQTTGAYAYPDSNATYPSFWGLLYNWYAVSDPRGLCPAGWRLPTHQEWDALTKALGGETKAGALLKARLGWFPGEEGQDSLGFRGLPSGFRGGDGTFGGIGAYAYWWSSTPSGINGAWGRFVDGRQPSVFMMDGYKRSAFSVRCVRPATNAKTATKSKPSNKSKAR